MEITTNNAIRNQPSFEDEVKMCNLSQELTPSPRDASVSTRDLWHEATISKTSLCLPFSGKQLEAFGNSRRHAGCLPPPP